MIIQPVVIRIPFQAGLSGPQRVERQRRFARLALDHCAKLSGAPAGPWLQTPERIPIPRDGFHWSIAHKPRFAAAVVARIPVGIDVESTAPRSRDLSTAVASPEEWTLIRLGRGQKMKVGKFDFAGWGWFFELWTAKEAVLKANSKGIGALMASRLSRVEPTGQFILSFEGREFAVEHFAYAGHIAACTYAGFRPIWHAIEGSWEM